MTVLDIGSGNGRHLRRFQAAGHRVTECDLQNEYLSTPFALHDVVWASHVLEHLPNVQYALRKMRAECRQWLAITVPPMRPEICGGHLTVWNAGLLLYNMICAGFDCSSARIRSYGYNVSVIVENKEARLPRLRHDESDIEALAEFFPVPVEQYFNGVIEEVNW